MPGTTSTAEAKNGKAGRHILLVEDNPADAHLAQAIHSEKPHCSWLEIVNDGDEAIRYLRRQGEYANKSKPDVVLLDIHLPMQSGLELIGQIRAIPGCEIMPIVIVSGSSNPVTMREAYECGANCVIAKSSQLAEYFDKLETCYKFWCSVVALPPAAAEVRESTPA